MPSVVRRETSSGQKRNMCQVVQSPANYRLALPRTHAVSIKRDFRELFWQWSLPSDDWQSHQRVMLSRKGTWSRKTRASIRRHHGSHTHQNLNYPHQSPNYLLSGLNSNHPRQHLQLSSTARTYLSTAVSARRSSVPNLQCLDPPRSTLPCRSDTDIASRCNKRLAALPEEMVSNGETRGHLDASRNSAVIQNFEDGSHELKSPWSAGSFLSKKCDSHGNIQSLQGTAGLKDLQTTFNTTIASSRSYTGGTNNVDRDHTFGLSDAERATRSGADNSSTCLRDTPGWKSLVRRLIFLF